MDKDTSIYYEGKKLEIKHLLRMENKKLKNAKKCIAYLKEELKQVKEKLKNAI